MQEIFVCKTRTPATNTIQCCSEIMNFIQLRSVNVGVGVFCFFLFYRLILWRGKENFKLFIYYEKTIINSNHFQQKHHNRAQHNMPRICC